MNETRYDWLSDRWVIFAPNREDRPDQYRQMEAVSHNESIECPFCSGREHETPLPTLVLPEIDFDETTSNRRNESARANRLPWQVRVVPNKFPAVCGHKPSSDEPAPTEMVSDSEGAGSNGVGFRPISLPAETLGELRYIEPNQAPQSQLQTLQTNHLFQRNTPRGAHEVIIESPIHVDSITSLPAEHIALIFEAYRRRLAHWRAQRELKYAVVFKNFGADAGASIFHSHSQLISLDFVPRDIERTNQRLELHHERYGCCYICQLMNQEEERQERIIYSSECFVALCPFASRFPYSFSIIPRTHRSRYEEINSTELFDLAVAAKKTLSALELAKPSAAYNFVLQTSPFGGCVEAAHHWRLRVIPRLSKVAGFEWGSECFINSVTPESAAKTLRSFLA